MSEMGGREEARPETASKGGWCAAGCGLALSFAIIGLVGALIRALGFLLLVLGGSLLAALGVSFLAGERLKPESRALIWACAVQGGLVGAYAALALLMEDATLLYPVIPVTMGLAWLLFWPGRLVIVLLILYQCLLFGDRAYGMLPGYGDVGVRVWTASLYLAVLELSAVGLLILGLLVMRRTSGPGEAALWAGEDKCV